MDTPRTLFDIKWQFSWDRRASYQKMRLFSHAYQHVIPDMFGVNLTNELYRVKDLVVSGHYDRNEYEKAFAAIERQYADISSIPVFKEIMKLIESFEGDFKTYIEERPVSYTSHTNNELLKAYTEFCEIEKHISLPNWVLFGPFEEIMTKTLRTALTKELGSEEKANALLAEIALPYKVPPLDVHNRTLYEIALSPEGKRDEMIDVCAKTFLHWGQYDVVSPEATRESFVKKLDEVQKFDVKKLIREMDEKYTAQKNITEKVLASWKGNEYIHTLLDLFVHYANYKDWKNYYREQSSNRLKNLLTEIGKRIGLSLEETAYLTEKETEQALAIGLSAQKDEINKRLKNSAFVFLNRKLNIITDPAILSKIDDTLSLSKIKEIKGTGAYPGRVKGTARIIISSADFGKLQKGDILVTSTTRPDYVPIMEKAAGFVTNEGGMLSHAAIVARELKKPCVIGTKTATKVFKDGDMLELDAEKGTVKIL